MQAFSVVHLQTIRTAFAVLAQVMQEKSTIAEPAPSPESAVVQDNSAAVLAAAVSQGVEDAIAEQFASLMSQQKTTAESLQAIAVQLAQLSELTKELKTDTQLFSEQRFQNNPIENQPVIEPKIAVEITEVAPQLAVETTETQQTSLAYFSTLPWSSYPFAEVIAALRKSASTEMPQIMQLATDSALKTAADAALLAEKTIPEPQQSVADQALFAEPLLVAEPESFSEEILQPIDSEVENKPIIQTSGGYFQALPWTGQAKIEFSEQDILPDDLLQTDEEFLQTFLQEVELLPQQSETSSTHKSDDYFQSLPWAKETSIDNNNSQIQPQSDQEQAQKRKAMLGAIFANKADVNDQDFLQMLEQPPKTNQPIAEEQNYFQNLPWG